MRWFKGLQIGAHVLRDGACAPPQDERGAWSARGEERASGASVSNHTGVLIFAVILFLITFFILGYAVDTLWFREDDLGCILNGLIQQWSDVGRVFFADCRAFITPINYQRTIPNVISGFLRPMQNIVFSLVYPVFGVNAWYYYLLHVAIHALNATLFFVLCSWFMPLWLAFGAGSMLALFPRVDWLLWIGTLQNSLALLFLLLMVMVLVRKVCPSDYALRATPDTSIQPAVAKALAGRQPAHPECRAQRGVSKGMSGSLLFAAFLFLLSLLSRESGIFLPLWLCMGAYITLPYTSAQSAVCTIIERLKQAFMATWMFFAAIGVYTLLRFYAFGIQSLPRTLRNVTVRFPWLHKYIPFIHTVSAPSLPQSIIAGSPMASTAAATAALPSVPAVPTYSWIDTVVHIAKNLADRFFRWADVMLHLPSQTVFERLLTFGIMVVLVIFLYRAYRNHRILLAWLATGLLCVVWPGFLTYPCSRYLNLMYPFIIVIVMYGVALLWDTPDIKNPQFSNQKIPQPQAARPECAAARRVSKDAAILVTAILTLAAWRVIAGVQWNCTSLKILGHERALYQQRFTSFFQSHTFTPSAKFCVVSSPFVSDIQSVFQACLNNTSTIVVFDLFTSLAERGTMGCSKDYRVKGVASSVVPIPGGFRLVSHDPEYCGWWLRFSDYPIAFLPDVRAYEWTMEKYRPGKWYPCSIGRFMINAMADDDCMTDVSFILDCPWIDQSTVFVAWNTQDGRYEVVFS